MAQLGLSIGRDFPLNIGVATPSTRSRRLMVALAAFAFGLVLIGGLVASGLETEVTKQLMLGWERNVAVWFSGLMLLGAMAAAGSSARFVWVARQPGWVALVALAVVLGLLAVDELGSLHERLDIKGYEVPWVFKRPVMAAFGLSLLSVAAYGLWRQREALGKVWLGVAVGFGLLGSVYAQEQLEHFVNWPEWALPLRLMVEEGTELLGTLVILGTLIGLRQRLLPESPERLAVDLKAARLATWGLLVATLPLIVLQYKMPEGWHKVGFGLPGQVPAILLMGMAAFCCGLRAMRETKGRWVWGLLMLAFAIGSLEAEAAVRTLLAEWPGERYRLDLTVLMIAPLIVIAGVMQRSWGWVLLAVGGAALAGLSMWEFMQPVAQGLGGAFGFGGAWLATRDRRPADAEA